MKCFFYFSFFFFSITALAQEAKVTTFLENFPANGFVSVDKTDHIYISEYGTWSGVQGNGTRVFKMNSKGAVIDTITNLKSPMGTAMDSKGNFYVNNDNNMQRGEVLKILPNGDRQVIATLKGWPSGMNIDANDNLYIPNYNKGILHKLRPDGTIEIIAESPKILGCTGVDFDSKGNIILSNFATARIYKVTPKGEISLIAEIPNIVTQNFGIGYISVIDDAIYATGIAVGKIFRVTLEGEISTIAGSGERTNRDGLGIEAAFNGPNGIRASSKGDMLYISEYGGSKAIRRIQL